MPVSHTEFRHTLLSGGRLVGTFVKTPTIHAVEILGDVGFDFVVLDEEHAAFDRSALDAGLLACRACGMAGLVRVSGPERILNALDCGATGVLVPHVATVSAAREAAALCRYRGGRRGFSGSPRGGRYGGAPMWEMIDAADAATTVVAQIEDPEALDVIDEIAATPGIDALFIGRGDLSVALGAASSDAVEIRDAVVRICAAARAVGKPVCVFIGDASEAAWLAAQGAVAFVVSSDQGFLRAGARQALASM